MRAKPEKCFSFAQKFFDKNDKTGFVPIYKEKTFSSFDPKLTISGQPITFINYTYEKMFKFLGWKMYVDLTENATKEYIKEYFIELMTTILDKDPVNGLIKLWLYQHYVLLIFSAFPNQRLECLLCEGFGSQCQQIPQEMGWYFL